MIVEQIRCASCGELFPEDSMQAVVQLDPETGWLLPYCTRECNMNNGKKKYPDGNTRGGQEKPKRGGGPDGPEKPLPPERT